MAQKEKLSGDGLGINKIQFFECLSIWEKLFCKDLSGKVTKKDTFEWIDCSSIPLALYEDESLKLYFDKKTIASKCSYAIEHITQYHLLFEKGKTQYSFRFQAKKDSKDVMCFELGKKDQHQHQPEFANIFINSSDNTCSEFDIGLERLFKELGKQPEYEKFSAFINKLEKLLEEFNDALYQERKEKQRRSMQNKIL